MHRFRDKDLRLSITAVLLLTLVGLGPMDAKSTAKNSQQSRVFTEALAEARRLADTEAGKAYEGEFAKVVSPRLGDIVGECTKNLGPIVKFQVVFVFAANGQLERVLGPKGDAAVTCMGEKFRDLHLPAPPHGSWPVSLNINISPDNGPRLLVEAVKLMESATWEVDATISRAFKFRVRGLLAGQDFDFTVEPEDRNAFRIIAIKDQVWTSFDGSKTWKLEDAKGHALAQRFYGFVHNPLRSEAASPALQIVKQETHDGDKWMQLSTKKSDKKKAEPQQTEYWIAISQDPKRNGVRRYDGPVTEPGHEKEPLHCVATYQPANDKTIQPPASATASGEQSTGQSAPPATEKFGGTVNLFDGKLKIDVPADFVRESDDPKEPKTVAKFLHEGEGAAWGEVLRGTHGLTPEQLDGYLKMRVAEYTKGFNWLPKDSHLQWLKKEIVTIDG